MKCPNCAYNHPAKNGMTCGKCAYIFTFNPKTSSNLGMTDGRFLAAIRSASQNGVSYFTKNQLYAAYCRRQKRARAPSIIGVIVALVIAIVMWNRNAGVAVVLPVMFAVLLIWSMFRPPHVLTLKSFLGMIDRWLRAGKPIDKMIQQPTLHQPPPDWSETDIYDYGVERILIVQRDELVDLMVLNNVHAEQRMLVISETGYPQYLMPHAKRVLEERDDLPVFLLHDADARGTSMRSRIASLNLPIKDENVIDLGMSADDFKQLKRTQSFDRNNRQRELPVDALGTSFLLLGLGACFATQTTLSTLLSEHARESAVASAGSSFG